MTIDAIEIFGLEHLLERERTYSTGSNRARRMCLVRIRDAAGASGWGECPPRRGVLELLTEVAQQLIGADASDAGRNRRLVRAARDSYVVSALDLALDDLRARMLGVPVHQLHGGAVATRFRVYAASAGYVEGEDVATTWLAEAARVVAGGLTALKLRIGRSSVASERPALRELRSAFPDLEVMADANEAYSLPDALAMGRVLDDLGFAWLEEPVPIREYAGYELLTARSPIAIAGGEQLPGWDAAASLVTVRRFDIVQPDVTICGGIGDALRIAELASLNRIECVPHSCNGAIGLAATLQLLALLPPHTGSPATRTPLLETDFSENPFLHRLIVEPVEPASGWVTLPAGPGLGVTVDEAFVRASARVARSVTPGGAAA